MSKVKFLLLMIIFVIFSLTNGSSTVLADVRADAENAINVAYATIIECYGAAAKAQEAGANITRLLGELNKAGEIYSKAVLAYRSGDYDLAIDLADECRGMLENFVGKANNLREEAAERSRWDFMVNFVGSIIGSVLIIAVSFSFWTLFKRKRIFRGRKIRIEDYRAVFFIVTFIVALIVASPALSRVLVYPRTEFFTELWILDSNHRAENYPFNITRNQNYTIYLEIRNRLGNCSYYTIEVKFKNQSQHSPSSFGPIENRTPSPLKSLYNISAFVADEQILELPLTFSFDYAYNENLSRVNFKSLTLNGVTLDLSSYVAEWNATRRGCYGFLFFELWLYNNVDSSFKYHGRFVGLWLNMTIFS